MRSPNVTNLRMPGGRAAARICVAAHILVAAFFFIANASRADVTVNAGTPSAAPPTPFGPELRRRYAGFYRYAGDAREQRARAEAVDQSVAAIFFAFRGIARAKVDDRTRIMPTCKFEFSDGIIRSTVPGYIVAASPESGAPAPYRVDGDAIVLSQHFEGPNLVQIFTADEGGTRKNEFALSLDGLWLTMKATLRSRKLAIPLTYTLTYRRSE